jgi:hypothetical protein
MRINSALRGEESGNNYKIEINPETINNVNKALIGSMVSYKLINKLDDISDRVIDKVLDGRYDFTWQNMLTGAGMIAAKKWARFPR